MNMLAIGTAFGDKSARESLLEGLQEAKESTPTDILPFVDANANEMKELLDTGWKPLIQIKG